jgi:cellobiose epimerase
MTRRRFLISPGVLALAILAQTLIPTRAQDRNGAGGQNEWDSVRQKVDKLARNELTQHWYPHAVDRERGGFHQSMARDWSLETDANAFLVYQARMTWTAAAFARYSPAHRDEFVQYARHGIAFLDQFMRDKERGGFHFIVDGIRGLRGQHGARGDRRRALAESGPRRV